MPIVMLLGNFLVAVLKVVAVDAVVDCVGALSYWKNCLLAADFETSSKLLQLQEKFDSRSQSSDDEKRS